MYGIETISYRWSGIELNPSPARQPLPTRLRDRHNSYGNYRPKWSRTHLGRSWSKSDSEGPDKSRCKALGKDIKLRFFFLWEMCCDFMVCTSFVHHAGVIAARSLGAALAPSKSDETKCIENLSLTTVIMHIFSNCLHAEKNTSMGKVTTFEAG